MSNDAIESPVIKADPSAAPSLALFISPHGKPLVEGSEQEQAPMAAGVRERIVGAFAAGAAAGLLHLATAQLQTHLPASLSFARDFGRNYLTRLCHNPALTSGTEIEAIAPPSAEELGFIALQAPPMKGLEYLNAEALAGWWRGLDELIRAEIRGFAGGAQAYLREKNPLWRLVGRVTFHLAENKRDESNPFAFMATYAGRLSSQNRIQHQPLGRALNEYAGAENRTALLSLLTPIQRASEKSEFVRQLLESRTIYQAVAWTPQEAYRFLHDIPVMEEAGLIVRVPDWWKSNRPPRPQVSVSVGDAAKSKLGVDALLDFHVGVTLEGERLTEKELQELLAGSGGGLVRLRGQWVEIDREKLSEALTHWKRVEDAAGGGGVNFFDGMRMLAGLGAEGMGGAGQSAAELPAETLAEWTGIGPGAWLEETLAQLRDPSAREAPPAALRAQLRPYQSAGVGWLRFMTKLGLGACLADDMGLGKTMQVLSLLLHLKEDREGGTARKGEEMGVSLLVVPASLIGNWKSEIARFAPVLSVLVAHPSEGEVDVEKEGALDAALMGRDLVITTYGMLARMAPLRERKWNLVILDEAQAIKNSGTRQSRAVKQLQAAGRLALTGTPIENRLSDLWSLFDFLNPGLLGNAKAFGKLAKEIAKRQQNQYGPLRALVRPYILRRLKTDKRIISDLPDKTEVKAFCGLTKAQAALYEQSVRELDAHLQSADGIQRRGIVLAYLMRLKQICNHPSQWLGDGGYDPGHSGKFHRLAEIATELAERQAKPLIFTQFREITAPLAEFLAGIFGRAGLVLHGGTPIPQRRKMVESFQRDDGPPFFILSLKAGGTGLNLTAASHVIHFDRWWNPAVENQATDRAFRIGQKQNVMVHKFVCRGTVEEKIDTLISEKIGLSKDLLEEGAERVLTEMDNTELLRFVALDINKSAEL